MSDQDVMRLNERQRAEYENKMKTHGLIKGTVGGFAFGTGLSWFLSHRFPVVRNTITLRLAALAIPTIFLGRVGAEQEYHHAMMRERGVYAIEKREAAIDYDKLDGVDKAVTFAKQNKVPLILGSFVASLPVIYGVISRDKLLTQAQIWVQVRMYAQAMALATIVLTAVASFGSSSESEYILDPKDPHHHLIHSSAGAKRHANVDNHWKTILDEEEK
ncbi:uncharacterized protein V1516DRAFT_669459 [Lipomyces oligophaga]|uniref:uncharacterized protein n=1 Tax=Lipomyces oligophaga TaxID=45792 RepID=UPI0034CECB4E